MTPAVSVVVPVYNVEQHLERCLRSLLDQTLADIEIIAVDDASTDDSPQILQSFSADPRLRILTHPQNRGLAATRNTGIAAARGEFVGFIDSDDHVTSTMFEVLYRAALDQNVDLVSCGYFHCLGSRITPTPFPLSPETRLDHSAITEALSGAHASRLIWFVWRNLYRRSLLTRSGLLFDEAIRIGEDCLFNLRAFNAANACFVVKDCLYYYVKHPGTLTSAKSRPHLQDSYAALFAATTDFYSGFGFGAPATRDLHRYVVRHELPALLANASQPGPGRANARLAAVLDAWWIRESLRGAHFPRGSLPLRSRFLAELSKRRLIRTLHIGLSLTRTLRNALAWSATVWARRRLGGSAGLSLFPYSIGSG